MLVKQYQEELREVTNRLVSQAERIKAEDRDYSEDESASFDADSAIVDELKKKIAKEEKFAIADVLKSSNKPNIITSGRSAVSEHDRKLAFHAWALGDGNDLTPQMKDAANRCGFNLWSDSVSCGEYAFDQVAGVATSGGNFLNGSVFKGISSRLKNFGGLLGLVQVYNTPDGSPWHWVPVDDTANKAAIIDLDTSGGTDVTNTSVVNGAKITLTEYDLATAVFPISKVLSRNTSFDLEGFVSDQIATRLSRGINYYLTVGSGSGQPTGLVTGTTARQYSESNSAFDYDDLLSLKYSIDPDYHDGSGWHMHSTTYKFIKSTFVDDNHRPLFLRGENYGEAGMMTIDGDPVYLNNQMPEIGAGNKAVIYGNAKRGMVARMVGPYEILRSNELLWKKLAIAVMGHCAMDSAVVEPYALGALVTGSTP